jgi:predicted dehydrogenase
MKKKIRIGIVGFGKVGKIRYSILKRIKNIKIVAICEKNPVKDIDKKIITTNSFKKFLDSNIDAAFICTYNKYLSTYTKALIRKKKHVFCEKPGANSAQELLSVIKLEKEKKIVLKYGFNHRYHSSVIEAKKIIDKNILGKIMWVRGVYGKPGGIDFNMNWRNYKKYSGGGILLDQGIHMLDLVMYLSKINFNQIKSFINKNYWKIQNEDNAFIIMKSKKNITAMLHSSATQWKHKFFLEFYFTNGYLILDGLNTPTGSYSPEKIIYAKNNNILKHKISSKEKTKIYKGDNSWKLEILEFIKAIKYGKKIINGNSYDTLKILKTIKKIYKNK